MQDLPDGGDGDGGDGGRFPTLVRCQFGIPIEALRVDGARTWLFRDESARG
jgi:hypothetical protein